MCLFLLCVCITVLHVGRHTKTTKGGRVFSFSATVIDGNGQGRAGWGYGKGPSLSDAIIAAQKDCEKNSFYIDRYQGTAAVPPPQKKNNSDYSTLAAVET